MKKRLFFIIIALCVIMLVSCNKQNNDPDPIIPTETQYSVSFNLNGYYGLTAPASVYLDPDSSIIEPTQPIRIGYTFDGWFKDIPCTQEWDFSGDKVNNHLSLYAKWNMDVYTISFDLAGGEGVLPENQEISLLEKVLQPANPPSKQGFIFSGWWKGANATSLTQEWNFATDLALEDITLYAGWGVAQNNADYSYIELDNCIKLIGYINVDITEGILTLPSIINDKTVLSIAKNAFSNLLGPTNIILPTMLTTINEKAFYNCDCITDAIIPDSVTSIGVMAFASSNLYKVNLGNGVRNIGEKAFYQCINLCDYQTNRLNIYSNVLSIEKEAFSIVSSTSLPIYNLEISNGLIFIGESAFRHANIIMLTLPNSVEHIGAYAFSACPYLTRIEIGKGIKTIGEKAFSNCNHGLYVVMKSAIAPILGSNDVFGIFTISNGVPNRPVFFISVPYESLNHYKTADAWNVYYPARITALMIDDIAYPIRPIV